MAVGFHRLEPGLRVVQKLAAALDAGLFRRGDQHLLIPDELLLREKVEEELLHERVLLLQALPPGQPQQPVAVQRAPSESGWDSISGGATTRRLARAPFWLHPRGRKCSIGHY